MAADERDQSDHWQLVTRIVAKYLSHHNVAPEQIPDLIILVHRTIGGLGKSEPLQVALTPAVPIRRSVLPDAVVCLECGWSGKMLRRHLTGHSLSAEEYRRRWGLQSDHPLIAPAYSE